MSSDFNKSGMDNYLKELAKEYRRMVGKNMPAEIVLVGGAAILANYGFRESTQDIDAIITAASAIKDAITVVGDRYDLPSGWLNSDFIKTDSYSPKLIEFSCYYRTFANVVTVRTIEAEYLIAMKLRAGRQYKYDLSDVIGILAECKRSGNPVSPEQIHIAYETLYGKGASMPENSKALLDRLAVVQDYENEYAQVAMEEKQRAGLLRDFQQNYPGAANAQNVNSILERLKTLKENTPNHSGTDTAKVDPEIEI